MKKIITLLLLTFALISCQCGHAQAQNPVTVDLSKLSPEVQKAVADQIELDNVTQKIETYGKWAGMGKEVGIAVKDGLTAVKDVTLDLADSKVGKVTIWLIVWKVAGKDVLRFGIGIILLLVGLFTIIRSFQKSCFSRRFKIEDPGFMKYPKKWEVVHPSDENSYENSNRMVLHALIAAGWIAICAMIMFI